MKAALWVVPALILGHVSFAVAVMGPDGKPVSPQSPYVKGELIVKLTPAAVEKVAPIAKQKNGILQIQDIPFMRLRDISNRFYVTQWRRLYQSTDIEKSGFPDKEAVYILTCPKYIDIRSMAAAFAGIKEYIVYAEPNASVAPAVGSPSSDAPADMEDFPTISITQ